MIDEEFKKQLTQGVEHVEALQQKIYNSFSAIQDNMKRFTQGLQSTFNHIGEILKTLPEDQRILHDYLSAEGWFLPTNHLPISATRQLSEFIEAGKYEKVEGWLQGFIKESIPGIKNSVGKQFPDRSPIVNTAIQAHQQKEFVLSIPTLLAQADGMFYEIMDTGFYSNNKKDLEKIRRRILNKLSENGSKANTSSFGFLMVGQLKEENILHQSYSEVEAEPFGGKTPFNRHMILHGKDLNYSTETNSLKAIALIGFLSDCKDILGSQKAV